MKKIKYIIGRYFSGQLSSQSAQLEVYQGLPANSTAQTMAAIGMLR